MKEKKAKPKDISPQELADALERATKLLDANTRPMKNRSRGSWFAMSHIILGLALVLTYQLTANLVPMFWAQNLPGGLRQAANLWGWPGYLWKMVVACHDHFYGVVALLAGIWLVGFGISTFLRPFRPLVWLMVVAVIALDLWIIYVMARMAIEATAQAAGIPLQ